MAVKTLPEFQRVGFDPSFVDYQEAWELQKRIHSEVSSGIRKDTVLLLEHSPVYTAGKRTELAELPFDGSSYVETDRGGKITWHGPGQLVGYPIMRLPIPIDVVAYVRYLEESIIKSLENFEIVGIRNPGKTGVWVTTNTGLAKIAAIGIRVSEKTTMHGFAVNCSNSLEPFTNIVACGLSDVVTTSVSAVLGRVVTPEQFAEVIEQNLGEIPNGRG